MVASVVVAIFYATRQLVPLGMLVPLFAISLIGDFGQMLAAITQWGMVPAGFSVLCLLTLFLYPISTSVFERITRELEDRAALKDP